MLNLKEFGTALRAEREKASYSLANFAKHTGGISKDDIRDYEEGKKVPDKLAIKKIVHCFPILMQYEHALRHETPQQHETRKPKPKRAPAPPCTRLQPPPRSATSSPRPRPKLEIVRHQPPPVLTQPLAVPLVQALRKSRAEMLTELAGMVKKRLGDHTAEDHDFTIKNDGKHLTVKLQVLEGKAEDLVESGCYLAVGPREADRLGVFCKTMTNGNFCDAIPRSRGVVELLGIAEMLHDAVKDRRFDG